MADEIILKNCRELKEKGKRIIKCEFEGERPINKEDVIKIQNAR